MLFVLSANMLVFSQEKVIKSDKKVMIQGKAYYIHTVKKGETLYAISKAYNILPKEIAIYNPTVFDGLSIGQRLKIPIVSQEKQNQGKFIYHTVSQGETIYYLTKKYNVKEKDIYKHNPESKNGIQTGQVLKIPKPKRNKDNFKKEDKHFYYHKVAKKETLYSISKKYDVEQQVIIDNNPEITVSGLKYDMLIKIPKQKSTTLTATKDTIPADSLINDTLNIITSGCINQDYLHNPVQYKIALLLPFSKDNDIINKEIELKEIKEIKNKPFLEFYEGFLLAVEKLQQKGLQLKLFVYDTQKDSATITGIIEKEELKSVDLIIGPVRRNLFKIVAGFAKQNNIDIIMPSPAKYNFTNNNPNVFQIIPSFESQLNNAIEFFGNHPAASYIIVHNNTKQELDFIAKNKPRLEKYLHKKDSNLNVAINQVSFKQKGVDGLQAYMIKDTNNVIFIPSADRAYVSDAVTRIFIKYHEDYRLTLVGFPVWTKFDNISLEYLHDMEFHTFTHNFVDYKNEKVKQFVKDFRNIYMCEPGYSSFLGYDIANYFLNAMMTYGNDFKFCLDSLKTELLQSKFIFEKTCPTCGYENTGAFIIKYDEEYNISAVRQDTDKRLTTTPND